MKKTLIAAAVAAVAVTPALAQQGPRTAWEGPQEYSAAPWNQSRGSTYVQAAPGTLGYAAAPNAYAQVEAGGPDGAYFAPGTAVVEGGQVIGQDPDPSIRAEFERNAEYYLRPGD